MMVHNITISKIRSDGIDFIEIIKEFSDDISKTSTIIGHNINFDLRIIINNLRKFSIQIVGYDGSPINNIFNNVNVVCTKKLSGGKSLEKLHMELYGSVINGAHDSLNDVLATLNCYIKLSEQNLLV
jgi:DNA polymerase-3 subunit alpha